MKKVAALCMLFLVTVSFTFEDTITEKLNSVYICTGTSSKKYHFTKNCRGLSACKATIKEVDKTTAINFGRTLCGWED